MFTRRLHWWRFVLPTVGTLLVVPGPNADCLAADIRVMSFNLWHNGTHDGQPLERSAAVIKAAKADVVGLQEVRRNAAKLAEMLDWHHVQQGEDTAILSRYPIIEATPGKLGVKLALPDGAAAYLFNVHLEYTPYQPYQLLKIPYGNAPFLDDEAAAIDSAKRTRGKQVRALLDEVATVRGPATSIFITGDFNEPSHLDWTAAAVKARLCPLKVEWPSTKSVTDAGFLDGYRAVYPDPVARPGITWTPTTRSTDPHDHHDRIDFVLAAGNGVQATEAQVTGESAENADIVVTPYPSDHRAVVVEFELPANDLHQTPQKPGSSSTVSPTIVE